LISDTLAYGTFMILLEILDPPIANFPRYFLNHVVLSLSYIYYDPVFRVLPTKRLVAVVTVFFLYLLFLISSRIYLSQQVSLRVV
jgi:hypothetical protein